MQRIQIRSLIHFLSFSLCRVRIMSYEILWMKTGAKKDFFLRQSIYEDSYKLHRMLKI